MSIKKEINIEELEKICGGGDESFIGLTTEEAKELNKLLSECYDAVLAKDRDKYNKLMGQVRDFRDAHPDAHDYVNHIIDLLKEVWRKTDIWF